MSARIRSFCLIAAFVAAASASPASAEAGSTAAAKTKTKKKLICPPPPDRGSLQVGRRCRFVPVNSPEAIAAANGAPIEPARVNSTLIRDLANSKEGPPIVH